MMQAPRLKPHGAAEWIGTIVGFMLAIPIVLGIIALLTLPFALPFAFMAVLLDEPLWWSLVLGLLVVLGCAVGLWVIDAIVKFTDRRKRARAAGQPRDRGRPLQRLLGWMVDHPRSSQWGPVVLVLVGGAPAFGLRWTASIAGILLLWGLLEWAWRRIRPRDEVKDDRLAQIRDLQAQGDSAAIRLLGEYVHDPLRPVSRRAVSALVGIGSPEATEALRRAVTEAGTQPVMRWARAALWVADLDGSAQRGKELGPT